MRKSLSSILPTAIGLLVGSMLCYLCNLIFQAMTYKKTATQVAGKDYVSEETRWPGHVHVSHIPVYYGKQYYRIALSCKERAQTS